MVHHARFALISAFVLTVSSVILAGGCDAPAATSQPRRRLPDKPAGPDADAPAVQSFTTHRSAFDEIRTMMLADLAVVRELRNDPGAIKPDGLSEERFRAYLALLDRCGVRGVSTQGDDLATGDVQFEITPPAEWPSESRASILYAEATGLQRVDNIAERLASGQRIQVARELDLKWYLVGRN